MQYRQLGRSGLKISPICLGTMMFGGPTDEATSSRIIAKAREAGINFIDSADAYNGGQSEVVVGRAISNNRQNWILATKLANQIGDDPNRGGLSRRWVMQAAEESLRRLGTDHIDIYHVHEWDGQTRLEETLSALDYAVTSGRAAYVGISNYNGWQSAQAATWQKAVPGRAVLASHQVEYSLLNRRVEAEVVPAAEAMGLGLLPWSPLGRGVLTGKYRTGTPADSRAASPHFANFVGGYLGERASRIVEAVVRAAEGLDWTPVEVALAWVRDRPGVVAPIVGARTAAQLKGSLSSEQCTLPPEIVAALDDVSEI